MFPQVVVPEAETRAGLTLKPQTFPLTVKDRPVMDVAFVQFLASVSGKVSCLGKMSMASRNRWFHRSRPLGAGVSFPSRDSVKDEGRSCSWAVVWGVILHLVLFEKLPHCIIETFIWESFCFGS